MNDTINSAFIYEGKATIKFVKNNKVYTIEGNSGGKVSSKEYPINTDWIIAYGSWY